MLPASVNRISPPVLCEIDTVPFALSVALTYGTPLLLIAVTNGTKLVPEDTEIVVVLKCPVDPGIDTSRTIVPEVSEIVPVVTALVIVVGETAAR